MLLNGKWILTYKDENNQVVNVDATVPGCIHTDLLKNGIIDDFYYRDNSNKVQWLENIDCSYQKTFTVDTVCEGQYLQFEGIDTYASIYLNGVKIGESNNMFIPHTFSVDGVLKVGENILRVDIRSPIKEVANLERLPGSFTTERLRTRRMQCTYGWDWVERFVTMGIFKDVRLSSKKINIIDNVYVYTKRLLSNIAQICVEIEIANFKDSGEQIEINIQSPKGETFFCKKRTLITDKIKETIDIINPKLWFPLGYGEQPLYKLQLKTKTYNKEVCFGVRDICILQTEDTIGSAENDKCAQLKEKAHLKERDFNEIGSCFTAVVNGVKIFCKGANWVPCEPFPSEETNEKITKILELSAFCGVNTIRVWGGGIFEKDHFYNECDRLGILVLQDFLMACGRYPEKEQWFIEELNKEAKHACLRLRNHPCLAWWHGDNENAVKGNENITDYDGYLSAKNGIEPIVSKLDPYRAFLPSSPYGGNTFASSTKGTTHVTAYLRSIFDYIESSDFSDYVDYFSGFISRFCSEQPIFGYPFVSSLKKFLTDQDIFGDDDRLMQFHSKGNPSMKKTLYDYFSEMAEKIFGKFKNGIDRVYKQQYLQCEWVRLSFESYRRNKWFSSGLLFWMLNDCWPASSGWAIIDYYCMPKPAFYLFKRCAKPVIASIERVKDKLNVYVCNDSMNKVCGQGNICFYNTYTDSEEGESIEFDFEVEENSSNLVCVIDIKEIDEKSVVICDIKTSTNNDRSFFVPRRFNDLKIIREGVAVISETEDEIVVKAESFQPFVMLDYPFVLEDNCFMMKKGECKTIKKCKST